MVDNRSAGFLGIGGSFNFKSGDISGTAAKTSDDKQGQGTEYFLMQGQEEDQNQFNNSQFVDRSAQLNATLNSLAMMNVAHLMKRVKKVDDNRPEHEKEEQKKKEDNQLLNKIPVWEDYQDENEDFLYVD